METARWFFLESVLALAALSGLALFFLLVHWRRGGSPRPLLIGLLVAALLLSIQALVVTPRERAADALTRIERDLLAGRRDALAALVSQNFASGEFLPDRQTFLDYVDAALNEIRITLLYRGELTVIESRPDSFRVSAAYVGTLQAGDEMGSLRSRWSLTFTREGGRWRITNIEPESIDGVPGRGWPSLRQ